MGKVFTITEGLENMGALKTGGQGSVFKGRRMGALVTAVKMLPTPVLEESGSDKTYADFINEVQKLKRVNEQPNPHVVNIVGHGITDSGSFPFIEMEFIEGPDLEELLQPPHDPIFSVREAIKVAEHLASALAHCHKVGVKHGDVKSNNVKFNARTGNYMLLDFGLSLLSDESRRTSLKKAGSVEFMAPEQSEGELLFQSDVYGFGVVLFELLAGTVPFPLDQHGDSARNTVLLAHRETAPPDILALRKAAMPQSWTAEQQAKEAAVPLWLLEVVYRCLEKDPESRYANGEVLLETICQQLLPPAAPGTLVKEIALLRKENRLLHRQTLQLKKQLGQTTQNGAWAISKKWALLLLPVLALLLYLWPRPSGKAYESLSAGASQPVQPKNIIGQYTVEASRAFFYKTAHADSRQGAYLVPSSDVIAAQKEENGFIYTEFVSRNNKSVQGWLRKQDLVALQQPAAAKEPATPNDPDADGIAAQLQEAGQLRASGDLKKATAIYRNLANKEVPEAMYHYGKMALQNRNPEIGCKKGYALVYGASQKGFTPAKTTIGFLFAFALNRAALQSANYGQCTFKEQAAKGAQLLLEATLEGDTTAKKWLKQLNQQQLKRSGA